MNVLHMWWEGVSIVNVSACGVYMCARVKKRRRASTVPS